MRAVNRSYLFSRSLSIYSYFGVSDPFDVITAFEEKKNNKVKNTPLKEDICGYSQSSQ